MKKGCILILFFIICALTTSCGSDKIGAEATIEALKQAVEKSSLYELQKSKSILEECGFYELEDLSEDEKKPPDFIVDGMIPVGLSFLSGAAVVPPT